MVVSDSIVINSENGEVANQAEAVWFYLVSLFNGISTFQGYLMPKSSL